MLVEEIYKKFHTPKHVIAHMRAVKNVCEKLANLTTARLDTDSLFTAALIHDALRICDFRELKKESFPYEVSNQDMQVWRSLREQYGALGHAKALHNYLLEINKPKLANLVLKHDFNQIDNLQTLEEKIIYYADKRADGERITSLKERLELGRIRNHREGDIPGEREKIVEKIIVLEKELAENLGDRVYSLQS